MRSRPTITDQPSPSGTRPRRARQWHPRLVATGGITAVAGVALVALAVTSPPAPPSPPAIRVTGGYIPQPASPDVATVYLTVHDDGGTPDELVGLSTPVAASATLHREVVTGGTSSMVPISGGVTVPAHGSVALAPGGMHAMLEQPRNLVTGDTATVTLLFARSGAVTVRVPVRGLLDGPAPADQADPVVTPPATAGGS